MDFSRYGFKTGKVILPGINLEVTLPKNNYFRNDGIVANIEEHTDKIFREIYPDFKYDRPPALAAGKCLSWREEEYKLSVIYLLDNKPETIMFNYGHESVHAIQNLGIEDQFVEMLKQEGFTLNPFTYYSNRELQAHVGGIMAFYRNNRTIPRIDTSKNISKTALEVTQVTKDLVLSMTRITTR
jgi:hypothetical protein